MTDINNYLSDPNCEPDQGDGSVRSDQSTPIDLRGGRVMERPNTEAIKRSIEPDRLDSISTLNVAYEVIACLIEWIEHLESTQPKDGEPYLVRAVAIDSELHGPVDPVVQLFIEDEPYFVVRNKVREEEKPRFYVGRESHMMWPVCDRDQADQHYALAYTKHDAQRIADMKNREVSEGKTPRFVAADAHWDVTGYALSSRTGSFYTFPTYDEAEEYADRKNSSDE